MLERRDPKTGRGVALVTALLAAGCATLPAAPPVLSLEDRVDALIDVPPFGGLHWGVLLVDPEDGSALYERNADRRFTPASNLKIPVTVAALGLLGPDYRWATTFHAAAPPLGGVVDGDLYVRGSGDPALGAPFFEDSGEALDALADSVWNAGVREVTGALVLDASAWDSTSVPGAWMVGNLSEPYSATGGAFTVARGELAVRVVGGAVPGAPATVEWTPGGNDGFVEGEVWTVEVGEPSATEISYLPESRRWRIFGTVEVGEERTRMLAARDPVRLGLDALAAALEARGVIVHGDSRILWEEPAADRAACPRHTPAAPVDACRRRVSPEPFPPDLPPLARHASPPLAEIVPVILGASQNWMTEQLVRTIGVERGGRGSWDDGLDQVRQFLEDEIGIGPLEFHFRDGSGLSAYNLATPRALVRTLEYARAGSNAPAIPYRAFLPAPGVADATLELRLQGMEGRVFAKTGTISHVNALSGYLLADDGRELVFSVITNASNLPAQDVRDRIDAVVRELASPRR